MATSKHFPVQISPRSDCEDFFNDSPYNSVTSFKSYQTPSCVPSIPSYHILNQDDNVNVLNTAPYSNKPALAGVIDNTVVSGYGRAKPPLPSNKPSTSRLPAYNSKAFSTASRRQKLLNTKDNEQEEKFGIKQLQSISEKLQEENSVHRRQRKSKHSDQVKSTSSQIKGTSSDKVDFDDYNIKEDSNKLSVNSTTGTSRSHSARRRLPNLPRRPVRSQSDKRQNHSSAENEEDKNEVDAILGILDSVLDEKESVEWDSENGTQTESQGQSQGQTQGQTHGQVVRADSKVAQVKVLNKLTSLNHKKVEGCLEANMQGDNEAQACVSKEIGDSIGTTGDSENNSEVVKPNGICEGDSKTSCANVISEISSHGKESGSVNTWDSKCDSQSVQKSTKLSKVDMWNSDNTDSEKDENLKPDAVPAVKESCMTSQDLNTVPDKLIESIKKNMELTEESELCSDEAVNNMPANLFFTFDPNVIQELTDSVMDKKADAICNKVDCQTGDGSKDIKHEINDSYEPIEHVITSPDEKVEFEGKSFNVKSGESNNKDINSAKSMEAESANESLKEIKVEKLEIGKIDPAENVEVKITVTKAKKVERSPSYRKKVMARAKSRYKKSSMLKDCSCTRNEKGEIIVCNFCATYESKRRSKSSLGLEHMTISGENIVPNELSSQNEISSPRRAFTPGLPPQPTTSNSPRPLRKVQVSSRVDLLMSTDLFKKHLHKHADLLQKHTMLSRTGLRKSVSSLDISDGFGLESDTGSQCETESVTSELTYEPDTSASDDVDSRSHDFSSPISRISSPISRNTRRHSLTGDSDTCLPVENLHKNKKKHFRTLPKSMGRSRPEIPSFTPPNCLLSAQRSNIPSFEEFKCLKDKLKATEDDNTSEKFTQANMGTSNNKGRKRSDKDLAKVTDSLVSVETVPLQLQVIQESLSKENLLACETVNEIQGDLNKKNEETVNSQKENEEVEQSNDKSSSKTDLSADGNSVSGSVRSDNKILTRQNSEPVVTNVRQRVKPKLKSRTLSRLEIENESLSDNASGTVQVRARKRPNAKRPRSLISKKSSLDELIRDSQEDKGQSDDADSVSDRSIKERPKLKVGHIVNRSKSDTRYEVDKGSKSGKTKSRPTSFVEKGKNSVTFDLEDRSQCSPFDIGESETSTSLAGSLSDSLRSEVNAEDNFQLPDDHDDTGKLLRDTDDVDADGYEHLMNPMDDIGSQVSRSTSDACEMTQEAARKKRERKERPYKSDPFSGTEIIPASKRWALREEKAKLRQRMNFANSSKEEILTFLDTVSSRELIACDSFPSLEELNEDDEPQVFEDGALETSRKIRKHLSNVSSLSTDSGVIGQDGSHDSQQSSPTNTLSHSTSEQMAPIWKHTSKQRSLSASCNDLSARELTDCYECGPDNVIDVIQQSLCQQCMGRRTERKKIVQEIFETEMNYGRDLNILKEEFYKPIMKAGLLNKDQLDAIFLNLDELIHVNKHFVSKLKSAIDSANHSDDNEMASVMIGCLFLESSTMFLTFENYCVNQAEGPVLLQQLEREKELLKIFLQVSQNDNQQLRRMHLKSFLMVPVQRIMKYPLLLDRLYKTTARHHADKNSLKEAKEKLEDILGHINAKSRTTSMRPRKSSQKSQQYCSVTEKIEVSRVALETLQWNRKDVCDVITSQLQVTQPIDHMWAVKKCKNYKFTTVYGVLLTLMQHTGDRNIENDNHLKNAMDNNINNNNNNNNKEINIPRVKSAAVVFIKEKNGRFQVMREPFMLEKCVVSQDPDYMDVFEILEWSKEAFLIKAETPRETKLWVQNLRQQMNSLGCWRKRRNALPNILLNHLS